MVQIYIFGLVLTIVFLKELSDYGLGMYPKYLPDTAEDFAESWMYKTLGAFGIGLALISLDGIFSSDFIAYEVFSMRGWGVISYIIAGYVVFKYPKDNSPTTNSEQIAYTSYFFLSSLILLVHFLFLVFHVYSN